MSKEDFKNLLNKEIPVDIRYNEDLVDRVHQKYPILKKHEIALIIKKTFESMRDLLVLGKTLSFLNLFFDFKIHFYDRFSDKIDQRVMIKIKTAKKIKKI